LIDEINYHWNSMKCKEELKILQQYSYITKLLTILTTGSLYLGLCLFLMVQILPKFLDIVIPLNESRPLKLLGLATFFFDQEKYFIPIFIHMTFGIFNSCLEISFFLLLMLGTSSLSINMFRMRDLIERIRLNWNELNNTYELEIIKKYSAIGRLITLFTILFIYLAIFSFILIELLLNFVLDIATDTNESRIQHFAAEIEVFIDQQKYFTPLLLYLFLIVLCGITTVIAMETLCMSYIQHACGLFEIAKFIEMTKMNFEWMYFIAIPFAILTLSINLYRLSRLITTEAYGDLITTLLFVLGHFWYLFFCNYVGQEVIDHSSDIFYKTYNIQWYMAPLKVQKLLLFVMRKSMRCCTLMIGGLFIPSLEGFATVKT
ncbi:hypothetical protein ALC56_12694, partial [Trachymyrmex septentrionalis]